MPRADHMPKMTIGTHSTLCTHTPMGVKGCGEVGTIGSPAAVINAVVDALSHLGVIHVDMPATPNRIWRVIQNADNAARRRVGGGEDEDHLHFTGRPRFMKLSALLGGVRDSMPLAGGMTLLPTIKQRLAAPAALIDLSKHSQLSGISVHGDSLTVGAMTRHVDVAEFGTGSQPDPLLAELAAGIGDPAVRNRGTIGGSVANS